MPFVTDIAGPQQPVQTWPPLVTGALRRTSTIDTHPAGTGNSDVDLRARDVVASAPDTVHVLGELVVRAHLSDRVIDDIAATPRDGRLAQLLGSRVGPGFRSTVGKLFPEEVQRAGLLHLLLDDWVGAALVSGYGVQHAAINLGIEEKLPAGTADHMAGICAGFAADASLVPYAKRNGTIPSVHGPIAPPLDPQGWHTVEPLRPHGMRRLRTLDHRGSANRTDRNMLVYLAADEARLDELDAATRDYLGWRHVLDNEADLDLTQNQKNQATQRQTQADQTVTSRLLQSFAWALVPAQPDPAAPFVIRETKVEGQSDSLADRVSRRLGNDGDLSTRQAAATIRLAIGKVAQIWKDGHVSLGSLWTLYCQYPYMPRLRDRRVLDEGIVDMPMIWQTDAFALATGFDEAAGRYIGLWTPDDKGAPPAATDSLLLVRPDIAVKQRDAEMTADTNHKTQKVDVPLLPPISPPPIPSAKTRFYGVKTLTPTRSPWTSRTSPMRSSPTYANRAPNLW